MDAAGRRLALKQNGAAPLWEPPRVGRRAGDGRQLVADHIGDHEGDEDEDAATAANRELEEETGYAAEHWEDLGEFFSSPGMTDESFTMLKATGLTKVGSGGGVAGEDITVHRVKLSDFRATIADFRNGNVAIDTRMLLALGPHLLC